jgi:hypothetical protein
MPARATRAAVLCVLALWPLSACGAGDGQGSGDRPSVTASLSPSRTLPSITRSPDPSEPTESEPAPTRSQPADTTSPDRTSPAPPERTTRDPEPESEQPSAGTSTVIAVPVPGQTSSASSPSASPSATAADTTIAEEENAVSPAGWVVLAFLATAGAIGTWLVVRGRRRRAWLARLTAATSEVTWFARELVPQLRRSGSVDQVVGGWQVSVPRVAATEDQLTVLSSSAPHEEDGARALQLRDAVRSARARIEGLSRRGAYGTWALDLDDVEALLVTALGPASADNPSAVPLA